MIALTYLFILPYKICISVYFLAENDIMDNSQPFSFTSLSNSSCVRFFLLDDNIIESSKDFVLYLRNASNLVSYRRNSITITLTDDDRKLYIINLNKNSRAYQWGLQSGSAWF